MRWSGHSRPRARLGELAALIAAGVAGAALYLGGHGHVLPALCVAVFVFFTVITALGGAIGWALTTAITAGLAQQLIATADPTPASLLVDDLTYAALLLCLLPTLWEHRRQPIVWFVALDGFLVLIAVAHALTIHVGLVQARQVFFPVLLLLAGYLIGRSPWRPFERVVIGAGALLACYAVVELTVGRPINPTTSLAANHEVVVGTYRGLPGFYYYYGLLSRPLVRAGSIFMNPPEAGLFLGLSMTAAMHVVRGRCRWPLTALLGLGTVLTLSRGGILVAVVGCIAPFTVRRLGRLATFSAAVLAIGLATFFIYEQAGAKKHVGGLGTGLSAAFTRPWGYGFGHFGDLAALTNPKAVGESSIGTFVGSTGLVGVALLAFLAYALLRRLDTSDRLFYLPALGLATLAAACFSETGTALNATAALWLCTGRALRCEPTAAQRAPRRRMVASDPALPGDHDGPTHDAMTTGASPTCKAFDARQ